MQRQQQRDLALFTPSLEGLTERQSRLLLLLGSRIAQHTPQDLQTLSDDDIAQATASLASTLETADRGIIYEHRTDSQPARLLADELKALLAEIDRENQNQGLTTVPPAQGVGVPGSSIARDAAAALRGLERAASGATGAVQAGGEGQRSGPRTAYRELLGRLLKAGAAAGTNDPSSAPPDSGSSSGSRTDDPSSSSATPGTGNLILP